MPVLTHQKITLGEMRAAGANMTAAREGRVAKFVYLAAIGLATIGWLWLIVWVVRQLI
jgi:hypothetical protein